MLNEENECKLMTFITIMQITVKHDKSGFGGVMGDDFIGWTIREELRHI